MEFQKKRLGLVLASLLATTMVSGCDWWSDDDKDDGLVCTAPQVPNDAGTECVDPTPEPELVPLNDNQVAIYYKRPAASAIDEADYEGWGLHLWNNDECDSLADSTLEGVTWSTPKLPAGFSDTYGAYYVLDLKANPGTCINFILHKGDEKALGGANKKFDLTQDSQYAFTFHGNPDLFYEPLENPPVTLEGAAAHWVSGGTLVWDAPAGTATAKLLHSADASIALENGAITGTYEAIDLNVGAGLSNELKAKFPHLSSMAGHGVAATAEVSKAALKHQLVAVAYDAEGKVLKATRVQIPGVIDDLYTSGEADADEAQLGAIISEGAVTFKLWAPTATAVKLHLFDAAKAAAGEAVAMTLDPATGIWSHAGSAELVGSFYKYEVSVYHPATGNNETVMVTDPYSVSLSTNSVFSQVVDLNDPLLKPAGWDDYETPAPESIVIYESHIRDFSVLDSSVSPENRGKYLAFTETDSAPMQHLVNLKQKGLTYFHLLPAFDIATVNEDPEMQVSLTDPVSKLCGLNASARICATVSDQSQTIQSVMEACAPATDCAEQITWDMRQHDGFNWGYDPFHFGAPEGSYASNPDGTARILEFRKMVKALHDIGLGVAMDVVYNHTNASGLNEKSVLDKVVPGYYHRLNATTGAVETSTCCDNTATEHAMMAKLMKDTLVIWTEAYKIDSFRFDLMGHQPLAAMEESLAATREVNPNMYFYGEGWNFGEVANDARFKQASQLNLAGTGIGSFSDRLRDAVRGGSPFDGGTNIRKAQGFATGLYNDPNELNSGSEAEKEQLMKTADQIMVELAGNLADYALINYEGETVRGKNVDYNGQPSGYTQSPLEVVTYVEKHDNQTFWDIAQYKLPEDKSPLERARAQVFALSFSALGQGVPFIHMGADLLRSKSMERDSYDSGDWFNRVDFTGAGNNWNVGLPSRDKDFSNWPLIGEIIANENIVVGAAEIAHAATLFQELLHIRNESKLFRLGSKDAVMARVDFHNVGPDQTPGVIVMSIDDGLSAGADLDPGKDAVVIVFNGSDAAYTKDLGVSGLALHPIQAESHDAAYGDVSVDGSTISVPGYTTAVFYLPQDGAQGAGIPVVAKSFANYRPFGDAKIYASGTFNTWGWDQAKFTGTGTYTAVVDVAAGDYSFKFAEMGWSGVDVGFGQVTAAEGSLPITDDGGNIKFTAPADGLYSLKLDAANDGAYTVTIAEYTDVAPFGDTVAYLMGEMNDWTANEAFVLTYEGLGVYSLTFTPAEDQLGAKGFKIANTDWQVVNLGAADGDASTLAINSTVLISGKPLGGNDNPANISATFEAGYQYTFTVDAFYRAEPTIGLTRTAIAAEECSVLPPSSEEAPFGATKLFVRGDHSSWAADAAYELTYKGNNIYQAVFTRSGAMQFKIADDTSNWNTQFYVATSPTSDVPKTGLELGTEYEAYSKDGGTPSNNTITLPATQVSFKVKVTNAAGAGQNAVVGTLLIEECPST